jgi:hypothetical protein
MGPKGVSDIKTDRPTDVGHINSTELRYLMHISSIPRQCHSVFVSFLLRAVISLLRFSSHMAGTRNSQ